MVKIELKEIVSNHDNRRKALNAVERGNKKTNPQYPYYGANGIVDFIDEYIFDEELLCIAEDGGNWGYKQNCSYIVNGKYWVNNHVHVLKPKKNVEIKYLMYYLNYTDLTSYITGTTRGKLTRTALDKIQINLPELEIQREIIIILDKINNLIEKSKKRIILLEELVKSRFIEMFGDPIKNEKGWEVKKLGEITECFIGITYKPEEISENGILVLRSGNIKNSKLNFENKLKIDKKINEKYFVKRNDILMCSRNGSAHLVGKVALINQNYKEVTFGAFMTVIRGEYSNYLYNYFKSEYFRNSKILKKTTTINQITKKELENISITLPPLSLQNEFAEFVTKTNKLKFEVEKSLKEMENLYDSLMQKFFKQ